MSLHDESFPNDEFFDKLNFASPLRFQFPNNRRASQQHESEESYATLMPPPTVDKAALSADSTNNNNNNSNGHSSSDNISKTDSSTSFNDDHHQNLSSETSSTDRPLSVLSAKTTASDPTGFEEENKKARFDAGPVSKATSCQNVHSEYTKRRYKHVQSKVGQYIAQMKAEDQRRRTSGNGSGNFQRHRSLPETLTGSVNGQHICELGTQKTANNGGPTKNRLSRNGYSAVELHKLTDGFISDPDGDLSEIMPSVVTTSGSSSSSVSQRHECSAEGAPGTAGCVDKRTFTQLLDEKDQIQSYSDYVQTLLKDKSDENLRLKHNIDYLRIELSNCQDKLKRQTSTQRSFGSGTFSNSQIGANGLARQSLQSLVFAQARSVKSTQTDQSTSTVEVAALPPIVPATPMQFLPQDNIFSTSNVDSDVFDSASNGPMPGTEVSRDSTVGGNSVTAAGGGGLMRSCKSVATIQPISLNFSSLTGDHSSHDGSRNSVMRYRNNSLQQHAIMASGGGGGAGNRTIRGSCPSSSDSAIDIEPVSPRLQQQRGRQSVNMNLQDVGEFIYYNGRSGRYATIEAVNAHLASTSDLADYERNHWDQGDSTDEDDNRREGRSSRRSDTTNSMASTVAAGLRKKPNSLRRRWLRFFAQFGRCMDANQSAVLDASGHTQLPLLEKSAE